MSGTLGECARLIESPALPPSIYQHDHPARNIPHLHHNSTSSYSFMVTAEYMYCGDVVWDELDSGWTV